MKNKHLKFPVNDLLQEVVEKRKPTVGIAFQIPVYKQKEINNLIPKKGFCVFNDKTNKLNFFDGTSWQEVQSQ